MPSWAQWWKAPWWANALLEQVSTLQRKVDKIMATQQELTDGVHQLFGVVDTMITRIQDGRAQGLFAQAAADALLAEMNTERQKAADALASVNPPAAPVDAGGGAAGSPTA